MPTGRQPLATGSASCPKATRQNGTTKFNRRRHGSIYGGTKSLVFQIASLTDVNGHMSGEVVLMTLLGGMGTVLGPAVAHAYSQPE